MVDYNICSRCGAYELGWTGTNGFVCDPCFDEEGEVYSIMMDMNDERVEV